MSLPFELQYCSIMYFKLVYMKHNFEFISYYSVNILTKEENKDSFQTDTLYL